MSTFRTTLQQSGKSATGIEAPEEAVLALGAGKRVAVVVTIGSYSYRSTVGPYRGAYMIPVSADNRAAAGISAGDEIEVTLALDDQPRVVEVPDDLAAALASDAAAGEAFRALSFSNQRAHVTSVTSAKAADTRARRIEKVLGTLGAS